MQAKPTLKHIILIFNIILIWLMLRCLALAQQQRAVVVSHACERVRNSHKLPARGEKALEKGTFQD